jgi:hypothetical protein
VSTANAALAACCSALVGALTVSLGSGDAAGPEGAVLGVLDGMVVVVVVVEVVDVVVDGGSVVDGSGVVVVVDVCATAAAAKTSRSMAVTTNST